MYVNNLVYVVQCLLVDALATHIHTDRHKSSIAKNKIYNLSSLL